MLLDAGLLSRYQSGFCEQHSTITATVKVVNDIIEELDGRIVQLFYRLVEGI